MIKILILVFLLTGCAVPQKLDPNVFYKRDMLLNVNGFRAEGVLVVPKSPSYTINVEARGKLDLFTFETCHREETKENAGESGIFGDSKKVSQSYQPSPGIEDIDSCPIQLGGYEKSQGRHSWAFIDFEGPDAILPALIKCNGSVYNANGVSVCQSKVGLIEEISFPVDVIVNADANCPMPRGSNLKVYRFFISPKECVFAFMEKEKPNRVHRLTTLGYSDILIRSN